jgi:hypothetical protein
LHFIKTTPRRNDGLTEYSAVRSIFTAGAEGEGEMDANQFFKSERKPVFHWFLLALLVFTIIDYLFLPR